MLVLVSCTSGGETPSVEASALITSDVQSLVVSTTVPLDPTLPFVPTFQLEMAFLTCLEELQAQIPVFEARHATCEVRVFGGDG